MNTDILRHSCVFTGKLLALGLLVSTVGGCADVVTYARDSREKGLTQMQQGDYVSASGSFKNAIRQDPADYQSHYYLAQSYDKSNMQEQAIQQYRTCLEVMDRSLIGKEDRAMRQKCIEGYALAIAHSKSSNVSLAEVERQPRSAENLFIQAKVLREMGDADTAIEKYTEAARIDPKDFNIAKDYGLYLEQLGQVQLADPQLRHAYALNQKDDQVSAALRRIGVVPGPSLKDQADLEKPVVPRGPIPEVDWNKGAGQTANRTDPSQPANAVGSSSSPRD